ncbi:MAG: RnfABCDGE type electron transport complex subunit D [Nakamurella sp.]
MTHTLPVARTLPVSRTLDGLLGRTSMYRLVLNSLILLGAVAFILSFTGTLAFPAADLGASLLIVMVSTVGSNLLFALLFRVRAHPESSVITGLLLWFILLPTSDPKLLVQVALAGVIASGSKYVFAFRGRHVVNPAAIGALWLALFEFDVLGLWWVGTKYLVIVAAVVGFLIVRRTRRVALVATFLVVVVAVTMARLLIDGGGIGASLEYTFLSTPMVFFAVFMLTEPLTLPPTHREQLVEAVVVGVLFAIPITVAGYSFGPETALVIGNLLAFALGQRSGIRLTLTGRRAVGGRATEFEFHSARPLRFAPGQYIELSVPHARADRRGSRRTFSIASSDRDPHRLLVAMTMAPDGSTFKKSLGAMAIGTDISATGIAGDFVLPPDRDRPVLLIAGGIGITPFLGQLDGLAGGSRYDVVVVYVQRDPADLAYLDLLDDSRARVVVVTSTPATELPPSFENVTVPRIDRISLAAAVPDLQRRDVYVSGPPTFVDEVSRLAADQGATRIRRDHFAGY